VAKYVLDASAVLALVHGEPGHQEVVRLLGDAAISSVNLSEVAAKLIEKGLAIKSIRPDLLALGLEVVPFDEALAFRTAELRPATRRSGLSLGDRVCLATAEMTSAVAVTADRSWSTLKVPVKVQVLR
jgi:PIN domain nuclease of toxin-antitoxin system